MCPCRRPASRTGSAEVVLGQVVDLDPDVVDGVLDPLLEGDVALAVLVDLLELDVAGGPAGHVGRVHGRGLGGEAVSELRK